MKKHVGSSFDEFLADEGLLSEAEATVVKRVIAYQLSQFMEENKLSKTAMAKRMQPVGPRWTICLTRPIPP